MDFVIKESNLEEEPKLSESATEMELENDHVFEDNAEKPTKVYH